jgi:hypothetical protein
LPESAQAGPSITVPATKSGSSTPSKVPQIASATAAPVTATPTASSSGSASRSTSPGPEAGLATSTPGSSTSTPAGTPSKVCKRLSRNDVKLMTPVYTWEEEEGEEERVNILISSRCTPCSDSKRSLQFQSLLCHFREVVDTYTNIHYIPLR